MAGTMFNKKFIAHLLLVALVINYGQAANILAMVPMPFYSHTINFLPVFKELAARGHNVTMVSPYPQKTPVANLTEIIVPDILPDIIANLPTSSIIDLDSEIMQLFVFWKFCLTGMPKALQFQQVQKLIKDTDSKFDLIITEAWVVQEPLVAFGYKFNAPVINIMPASFLPLPAYLTGNGIPVSYAPITRLGYTDHMTFFERVKNCFHYYWDLTIGNLYYLNQQDAVMREYFKYPGSENLPPLKDMLRNTSLTLMDQNIAVGYPVPLHKNVVPFGGINIHSSDKLPADLQKVMDDAKDGVIYFSLGSFLSIAELKPFTQDAILSVLGKLKYKTLMKLDDPSMLDNYSSKNILVRRWFPQTSILAHPNCKLFITHGGLHGLMEAIYHAVPVVVIPMIADQKFNARFIETVGIGYMLDRNTITEEKMLKAIQEVLNNPSYRENIHERSAIIRDQPISIMDNVIYWIEYVIRHKGAPHLRPAVLDLYWFQVLMLDVIAFYLLIVFVIVYTIKIVLCFILRALKRLICRRSCKKDVKKSKKE